MRMKNHLIRVLVILLFFFLTLSVYGKARTARKVTPEEASELIRERGPDPDFIAIEIGGFPAHGIGEEKGQVFQCLGCDL